MQDLEYGRSSLLGKSTSSVAPGESFELRVNLDVEAVKHVVQEKAVGEYLKMNRALLSAEIIEFTDNTRWVVGEFLRFDAQKKKWIGVIQPEPWSISEPTFEPATFKPPQQQNCYKSAHDSVDCPGDCGCGTVKPIATPGDPVNAGNFEAPKFQFCCTKDGFQCLVAYDGIASGCTSN